MQDGFFDLGVDEMRRCILVPFDPLMKKRVGRSEQCWSLVMSPLQGALSSTTNLRRCVESRLGSSRGLFRNLRSCDERMRQNICQAKGGSSVAPATR